MKRDYLDFQDRSVAKAFLITFRCYGTWLHGDERGSVDRRYYNQFGTATIAPNAENLQRKAGQMKHEPFFPGTTERKIVKAAIKEVCTVRDYGLFALNVRTNHVHSVVSNSAKPERIMDSFKAYSTRALRSVEAVQIDQKLWSRHGSTRYLWTDDHITAAVDYVLNAQGDELPTFD